MEREHEGAGEHQNDRLTGLVIGAAIEVHRALGPGWLEAIYERAMATELRLRAVPFRTQGTVPISYKNNPIGESRIDMLVNDCLIIELKSVETLTALHRAQLVSYLKATGIPRGLLINFNVSQLTMGLRRVTYPTPSLAFDRT